MLRIICVCFGFLASIALSTSASAALLTLSAVSQFPTIMSDFTIDFDDINGNSVLEYDEIISFSGVTQFLAPRTFDTVIGVADLPGIATLGGPNASIFGNWVFMISSDGTILEFSPAPEWEYSIAATVSDVPLPAAMPLFLAGIAGLRLARRKRRKL
jgi:hypothetical protein